MSFARRRLESSIAQHVDIYLASLVESAQDVGASKRLNRCAEALVNFCKPSTLCSGPFSSMCRSLSATEPPAGQKSTVQGFLSSLWRTDQND